MKKKSFSQNNSFSEFQIEKCGKKLHKCYKNDIKNVYKISGKVKNQVK